MAGRPVVLAAGKAMRKQRDRANLAIRAIKQGGQRLALGIAKIKTFGGHEHLLRGDRIAMAFAATVAVDGRISTSTNSDGGPLEASKCCHSRGGRCARAEDESHEPGSGKVEAPWNEAGARYRPSSRIAASSPSSVSGYIRPPMSCRI